MREVDVSLNAQRAAADAAYRRKFAEAARPGAAWRREAESWFDGSVDSVDRRIAACDRLLAASRTSLADGLTPGRLAAVDGLGRQREALEGLRRQLLTAGADVDDDRHPGRADARLGAADRRWVELEAPRFVRANLGVPADEASVRARDLAELKTSALAGERSRRIVDAFVHRVAALHAGTPRPRTASAHNDVVPNCADEMMFM